MLGRGDLLGGYRIDDIVGVGGMAIVYRAEQISLGRRVALKVLSPQLSRDEAFRERFRREGKHAAALHHPNVVTIFDSGEADGRLFIAMLLVEGSTLADWMADGLSADETVSLLTPVSSALDAAHALGLVHRDIKPQNILIEDSGHAYVADFGVAKTSIASVGLTATGGFVGSLNYAAPEQIRGEPATGAADIYALGAVLYQCLTGQVPYPRDTDAGVMFAHLNDPVPTLSNGHPSASAVDRVVARAMSKDPAARYSDASQMIAEATAAIAGMDSGTRRAKPAFSAAQTADDEHDATPRRSDAGQAADAAAAVATADTAALPLAVGRAQTPRQPDITTADRRRTTTDAPPTAADSSTRRTKIAVAVAAVAILCVAGLITAVALSSSSSHTSRPSKPIAVSAKAGTPKSAAATVDVTSPSRGAITAAEDVAVKGTMTPADATVQIQGKTVPSGNGVFVGNVPIHAGANTVDIIASAPGYTPATATMTLTGQSSTQSGRSLSKKSEPSTGTEPASLMQASSSSGAYTILVPSNWSLHSEAPSGQTNDLWVGPNPLEKLSVIVSTCSSCATSGGSPDAQAVGLPSGTVSSFSINQSALGFEAYSAGNANPDNGVIVVTSQGSETTGYAQVDLWLPSSLHSTATRILNSFSLLQAATG